MRLLSGILAVAAAAAPVRAQILTRADGGRTASLGQPSSLKWTAAAGVGQERSAHLAGAFGLERDLLNPMLSMLALHTEVYARAGSDKVAPGLRARLVSPFARFGIGADYRPAEGGPDLLLSLFHPMRRGGLFADGSILRLDYLPGREHGFTIGIEKPVLRRTPVGRSRPAADHVRLPAAPAPRQRGPEDPLLGAHLATISDAARHIRLATLPLGPVPARSPTDVVKVAAELQPVREALRPAADRASDTEGRGSAAVAEARRYHRAVDHAFSTAAAEADITPQYPTAQGLIVAAAARRILLHDVLLPYNRLLGQTKRPDNLRGIATTAHGVFERWLQLESGVPAHRRDAVLDVFQGLLRVVEENRAALRVQWRDSRFVWLPLQYALLPEEHDTQDELDTLIEQAVGVRFADGNFVSYLVNEQFQYHLSRTIREAADYHVLWTHDFRGINGAGAPDEMSYRHVLHSYLAAMRQRVREYDATGRFPAYIIVMDQWFYEVNRGRLWMTLLEDPLSHRVKLPPSHSAWDDSLAAAQHALRQAVAASSLLQSQARTHGDGWLKNRIKVHVNITNPADPSFWSTNVVSSFPLPDNMMRDHRKIVFYDITEDDPYRGEAIFTGAGVGEHYANLSWEDRSLLVRGPALLPLKTVARELLVDQGLPRETIPHALLPRPRAADYDARVRSASMRNQQPLRALQVHNGAGFSDKEVNVVKAVLYTLMPPGSVIKIPDSLWNNDLWGACLLGSALRGVRVLIIAPAEGNAPADVFGTLGRSREMLGRLATGRHMLASEIADAGGLFRVGIYRSDLEVTNIPEKVRLVNVAFTTRPWLRSLFGFPQSVLDELGALAAEFSGLSMAPQPIEEFAYDPRPKLHLKANFFASAEAWTLMNRSEWAAAAWAYMQIRVGQVQTRSAAVHSFEDYPEAVADVGGGMIKDWYAALDAKTREHVVFYTLMGSHNQNSRSFVIDAEVGFLISQWPSVIPYMDLITIMGQTQWIEEPDDLAPLLPLDTGWRRRVAHWARLAL
jgi:hypothetical protein